LLDKTPEYYRDFYALTHENMRGALRILANLAVPRADQRVALRLLHLEEAIENPGAWIRISQQELAAMVAVSLPTLQRVLQDLSAKDMVEIGYGKLRVTGRDKLFSLCQT
jgi:CRP-like cAMP-binding protein